MYHGEDLASREMFALSLDSAPAPIEVSGKTHTSVGAGLDHLLSKASDSKEEMPLSCVQSIDHWGEGNQNLYNTVTVSRAVEFNSL